MSGPAPTARRPRDGWAWCLADVVGLFSLAVSAGLRGERYLQGLWTPTDRERRQIITAARRLARGRSRTQGA